MRHSTLPTLTLIALLSCAAAPAWSQDTGSSTGDPTTSDTTTGTTSSPGTGPTGTGTTGTTRSDTTGSSSTGTATGTGSATMDRDDATMGDGDATMANRSAMDDELPSTATPLWLLSIVNGLALGGVALALRMVRRLRGA